MIYSISVLRGLQGLVQWVFQVRYLSSIHHRNLVTLLGYCQESNTQFLVYEYVPNGSVSSHLYGNSLSLNRD